MSSDPPNPEFGQRPGTPHSLRRNAEADLLAFQEMQLVLSEKRTAFAGLRTGIAVFALPLSVLSVLIATSKMYELQQVMQWLVPLLILNAGLVVLGCYLIIHGILRVHRCDHMIYKLKKDHSAIAEFV